MAENHILILLPMFNDWDAANRLLNELDATLAGTGFSIQVMVIDDGSTDDAPADFGQPACRTLRRVEILRLRRNLGHQRAIAVGLVFVYEHRPCDVVVVMDSDGEDRPADLPALLRELDAGGRRQIVFAARAKRLENFAFRALYQFYRVLHWAITGDPVRVGNFSALPFARLSQLVVVPEIWNHYAAAVIRSGLPFRSIPIARGRRYSGKSKMNFIALLLHGLSAFFVYGDIVGARLLVAIALALIVELVSIHSLIPSVAVLLGVVLLQAIPLALILVFTVVGSRTNAGFLPIRDCPYFVDRVELVGP